MGNLTSQLSRNNAISIRFNNQPAKREGKEQLDCKSKKLNERDDEDFKIHGMVPAKPIPQVDSSIIMGLITTFSSTVTASW